MTIVWMGWDWKLSDSTFSVHCLREWEAMAEVMLLLRSGIDG